MNTISNNTIVLDLKYVSLTAQELNDIRAFEAKINTNRQNPVYLLAFENIAFSDEESGEEIENLNEYNVYSVDTDTEFSKELIPTYKKSSKEGRKKEKEKAEDTNMLPWHIEDL